VKQNGDKYEEGIVDNEEEKIYEVLLHITNMADRTASCSCSTCVTSVLRIHSLNCSQI
jgi:hypothetical protein